MAIPRFLFLFLFFLLLSSLFFSFWIDSHSSYVLGDVLIVAVLFYFHFPSLPNRVIGRGEGGTSAMVRVDVCVRVGRAA